ncbi:hypothetical protein FHT17_004846 [Novosphingobium sp. SG916]|nr:hypothetical protein [Novosphingobium sp. SG720]NMN07601.1 hypothetical protein [Novosphingobium sp. SG919]NMN89911.1 hypothetical protein [Novosphingobium sp. SG916]
MEKQTGALVGLPLPLRVLSGKKNSITQTKI